MQRVILISGILLMGLALYGQETPTANLAQNPGFENASVQDPTRPDWWRTSDWGAPSEKRKYTWDDKVAHTGKRSVCIECPLEATGVWVKYFWPDKEPRIAASFKPDKFYQMSVWVKAEAGTTAQIILDGCEVMGARPVASITGPQDWKQLVIKGAQLKADANPVSLTLVCRCGKVWFDDVEVVEMPQ